MKALILAAGSGTRMPECTDRMPKVLIPVLGVSVLERMLDALMAISVREVVITTGHLGEQIEEFIAAQKKYKDLSVTYSFNPQYRETNYITSMWNARDFLENEDILLLHGDMVFDRHILEGIAHSKTSAVCIREGGELPQKDFKARVTDGRVVEISTDIFGKDARACMPIYKLLSSDMALWMEEIGKLIKAGDTKCYAEKAFNAVSDTIELVAFPYTINDLCMEVDTTDDVREAERQLSTRSV